MERVLSAYSRKPELNLINVNLPEHPSDIKWTRQSVRQYDGKVMPGTDPMGRKHYWFTVVPLEPAEEGTDRWAVEQGYVSVTPLRLDLTNEQELMKVLQKQPVAWVYSGYNFCREEHTVIFAIKKDDRLFTSRVWLRGPLPGIPPLLQPVAHALTQAREDVNAWMTTFPETLLWERPAGVASVRLSPPAPHRRGPYVYHARGQALPSNSSKRSPPKESLSM